MRVGAHDFVVKEKTFGETSQKTWPKKTLKERRNGRKKKGRGGEVALAKRKKEKVLWNKV